MASAEGLDVEEGEGLVALEELHRGDIAFDDLTEDAAGCHFCSGTVSDCCSLSCAAIVGITAAG